ncbi:MAG: hypothetical protein HYW26_03685 [Candidatus Aenigmarchaeota archaeon]|nr:hypothetical protein [Candidatus Aenigmarchaeota archaeon]
MGVYEFLYIMPFVVVFYLILVIFTPLSFDWLWFALAWIFDLIDYVI